MLLVLALALALFAAPAAAQEAAAELEGGITWDTTVEQMLAAEGATANDNLNTYGVGDFLQYGFDHNTGDVDAGFLYYIFKNDSLVMYGKNVVLSYLPEGTEMNAFIDGLVAQFTQRYGEPVYTDAQLFADALNTMEEGAVKPEDVDTFTGWDAGGGTDLYLVTHGGDSLIYVYVNKPLLSAQGA